MDLKYELIREVKSPLKGHETDAGIDLFIPTDLGWNKKWINSHSDIRIPSGIKVHIPEGWCGIFLNKSGVAYDKKLMIGGQVIDSGYTGEIHLHLINTAKGDMIVKAGQKIAQLLIIPVPKINLIKVENYERKTERGTGGFGSTGDN